MSSPVPRTMSLLLLLCALALFLILPRSAGATDPPGGVLQETSQFGIDSDPAPDVDDTDPTGPNDDNEGHPTDIDEIIEAILNALSLVFPNNH